MYDFTSNMDGLNEEMIITRSEYKRMQTAEILLRVVIESDISAYGSCTNLIDAIRKVFAGETDGEIKKEQENNAE